MFLSIPEAFGGRLGGLWGRLESASDWSGRSLGALSGRLGAVFGASCAAPERRGAEGAET
eukprot:780816-Pyramimonas_sp.AAC.1